jgi:hypothetical protein
MSKTSHEDGLVNSDGSIKCKIPCDICGDFPAYWYGRTNSAICDNEECEEKMDDKWIAFLERMEDDESY